MFGRDQAGALDVLHSFADQAHPIGVALAEHGLTGEAMTSWRWERRSAPIFDVKAQSPTPDVEQALSAVFAVPVLRAELGRARVAEELLSQPGELTSLFETFSVNSKKLRQTVRRARSMRAAVPSGRPKVSIVQPGEQWVVVPAANLPDGRYQDRRSLAIVLPSDSSATELGEAVLAQLGRFDSAEDESSAPYWERAGFRTEVALWRRTRCLGALRLDFGILLHPTRKVMGSKLRYDVRDDRISLLAPEHDRSRLGSCVSAATAFCLA